MKRTFALLLALLTLFLAVGCNDSIAENANTTSSLESIAPTDAQATTATPTTATPTTSTTTTSTPTTAPGPSPDDPVFMAGYSRVDITPDFVVSLNSSRNSVGVHDHIYATCVATSNNCVIALFITVDVRNITNYMCQQTMEIIEDETGIPAENVIITATHNHSSPDTGLTGRTDIAKWFKLYYNALPQMLNEAIADLAPAEMQIARTETEGMNFVRRYLMADGTYNGIAGTNSGKKYVAHETEADPEFQVIKFERGDKKDIVITNWQAHAAHALGMPENKICADFISYIRDGAEEKYDCLFAYYQGACGNINFHSNLNLSKYGNNYIRVGRALVDVLGEALENLEPAKTNEIKAIAKNVTVTKKNNGGTEEMPISAISIGDVAFIAAPYEMFDTNGMEIKDASEFEMTFICAYANGRYGYIPSNFAFPHGDYEVQQCKYVQGTGEQIANEHIALLKQLYDSYNTKE